MTSIRNTHGQLGVVLAVLLVMLALPRAAAANPPIFVGTGTAASCTQVALQNALVVASGSTIRFRCGKDPVTISLTAIEQDPDWGPVALTPANDTTIDGGGLITFEREDGISILVKSGVSLVLKNLAIVGGPVLGYQEFRTVINLGTLTIHSAVLARNMFGAIENDATLNITNSVITDGTLGSPIWSVIVNTGTSTIDRSAFLNNGGSGAIANTGTLHVKNSIFSKNQAEAGGAIVNYGSLLVHNSEFSQNGNSEVGGAIWSLGDSFIVRGSTFSGNHAGQGGAIAGSGIIEDCQFFDNVANNLSGGAIRGGSLTITRSTFRGNYASWGGGAIDTGDALIRNSMFSDNEAEYGGGIETSATLRLTGSTVTANRARSDGGGVYVAFGGIFPTLVRTSVTGNTPSEIVVQP